MQPILRTASGTIRFQRNAIVEYLLENGGIYLNILAELPFSQADREQFAQLIGYSVCGFHELSYVSDATANEASAAARIALELPDTQVVGCRDIGCEIHSGVERET